MSSEKERSVPENQVDSAVSPVDAQVSADVSPSAAPSGAGSKRPRHWLKSGLDKKPRSLVHFARELPAVVSDFPFALDPFVGAIADAILHDCISPLRHSPSLAEAPADIPAVPY